MFVCSYSCPSWGHASSYLFPSSAPAYTQKIHFSLILHIRAIRRHSNIYIYIYIYIYIGRRVFSALNIRHHICYNVFYILLDFSKHVYGLQYVLDDLSVQVNVYLYQKFSLSISFLFRKLVRDKIIPYSHYTVFCAIPL